MATNKESNSSKETNKFEDLLCMIDRSNSVLATQIASVTDIAVAAKYWLQDNMPGNFTAADVLKLSEMIISTTSREYKNEHSQSE
jgi:hypothetical protein